MGNIVSQISRGQGHELLNKLESAGLTPELAQRIVDSKGNTAAKKMVESIKGGFTTYKKARGIMGRNFFGTEDMLFYFKGYSCTKEDINFFAEVPWSEDVLESCKDTHVLVAVPSVSIHYIQQLTSLEDIFHTSVNNNSLYKDFVHNRCMASWQLIKKIPVTWSEDKNYSDQLKVLYPDEEVPSVQVVVYAMVGHFLKTKERLFREISVRTSTVDSIGQSVAVGHFNSNGMIIGSYGDGQVSNLALASAKKLM